MRAAIPRRANKHFATITRVIDLKGFPNQVIWVDTLVVAAEMRTSHVANRFATECVTSKLVDNNLVIIGSAEDHLAGAVGTRASLVHVFASLEGRKQAFLGILLVANISDLFGGEISVMKMLVNDLFPSSIQFVVGVGADLHRLFVVGRHCSMKKCFDLFIER